MSAAPLVGVAAEYSSNPELLVSGARSETHSALFVDLPAYYDLDRVHFSILPRVRYGGSNSYSSVTSNYYHLDASAQFTDDRGSLTGTGSFYRDSSLLYAGELANGIGVRRDTSVADVNWQRLLTELLQFQVDANTARTLYAQRSGASNLVDYRYTNVAPAFLYATSERDTVRLTGSFGRYHSLNGASSSDSQSLQLGFDHRLTEIWKLTASAGYSKSTDRYNTVFGTFDIAQNGSVYALNLNRQSEVLTLTGSVSRALTPTGSAFLSRQDTVNALGSYSYSERWTFGLGASWQSANVPLTTGGTTRYSYFNADLSTNWRCTEQWTVSLHLLALGQRYARQSGLPSAGPNSDGARVEISRQFYRTNQQ